MPFGAAVRKVSRRRKLSGGTPRSGVMADSKVKPPEAGWTKERKMDNERIAIRGTVTRDPELSTTPKGKIYTRINVAADEVTIDGNKMNASENKYQSVVFWG